jgi:hypothetical protein
LAKKKKCLAHELEGIAHTPAKSWRGNGIMRLPESQGKKNYGKFSQKFHKNRAVSILKV